MPGGRSKDRIRQTSLRIGDGIPVERGPAGIVVCDDVDNEIERHRRLELCIAECSRELTGQGGVIVHHNRTVRIAGARRLDEHGSSTLWIGTAFGK